MANLRILDINASDIRTIAAKFNYSLDPLLSKGNFVVQSLNAGVPDAEVTGVYINEDIVRITVQPLTPYASYELILQGTESQPFRSADGKSYVLEDGRTNVYLILAPEEAGNVIRDNLVSYLKDNVYNLQRGTFVRLIIDMIAKNMLKTMHDIRRTKNDNYLSFQVFDERKVRGNGPFDRLNEEGAYQVLRVGKKQTGATTDGSFSYDRFPSDLVTLQRKDIKKEVLIEGSSVTRGTFDKLILTLNNGPITKVSKISIAYQNGNSFIYSVDEFGYQINNPQYDTEHASTFLLLKDNQVKLSDNVLDASGFVLPANGDTISVDYEYKYLGRFVDESSITVTQSLNAVREPTPAIINQFNLSHAPILDVFGEIATVNGVQFLDPNSATPFLTIHPAFRFEIPFDLNAIPGHAGEYAVDYASGKVIVYGADSSKNGTGPYPPAATYKYQFSFVPNLDYTYRADTSDLAASPIRENLIDEPATVRFTYEEVLIPGTDYKALTHVESLNERIENRLLTTGSLQTKNDQVTDVYRIFNETTSEIYPVSRFHDNVVYFNYINPPNIQEQLRETVSFENIQNETIIITNEIVNILSTKIYVCQLLNTKIMAITDDVIGSSYNSSAQFSETDIFKLELYYDEQELDVTTNINRLNIGDYQIDYRNGIIYVGVSNNQDFDLGTVSYKRSIIIPSHPHLISVSNIYYSTNINLGPTTILNYNSFGDQSIIPSSFNYSDERFFNNDVTQPYIYDNGTIRVSSDIKTLRHIFDAFDLNNNDIPTDFASNATFVGNIITVDSIGINKRETLVVGAGRTLTVSFISPGINVGIAISAIRMSDGTQLIDGYETIVGNTITLSVPSGAAPGNVVDLIYTVVLNGGSTPVIDYSHGDYLINYTYLADEILVSYEYGDNVLDFRESFALGKDSEYYVTYRAGAGRTALLDNFGSSIDIDELRSQDVNLNRETYRDALTAALQSFTKGPTIPAIKGLASNITKIQPQLNEALFDVWSLGISHLYRNDIVVTGEPQLTAGKFDQGILINESGQSVQFPVTSNIRLDGGTIEFWTIPEWNGLDNDAKLTFSNLKRDGYNVDASSIYIGAGSYNPVIVDGEFSVNKRDSESPIGIPSAIFTRVGLFIYFDDDTGVWKVIAKDMPGLGYVYTGNITSGGEVYDVKYIDPTSSLSDTLRSTANTIYFAFNMEDPDPIGGGGIGDDALMYDAGEQMYDQLEAMTDGYVNDGYGYAFGGIKFMADAIHYLVDYSLGDKDKNRISVYKDGTGYLNFSIWDRGGQYQQKKTRRNNYKISADIQDWKAGEKHFIGISWKLNTPERRDEMHLFVDGFEVPNILRYGGRPLATINDRFRTVQPEIVAGTVPKTAIAGNNLITNQGSAFVQSLGNDFSSENIVPGDAVLIDEISFSVYQVISVNGNTLELDSPMPATLQDARFSVNPYSVVVASDIDLYANVAVSTLSGSVETEIPGPRAVIPAYSISQNSLNQNVLTILGDALAGDQILIRTLGLNHRRTQERVYLWGNNSAVLKTNLPPPINLDEVSIRPVLMPYVVIGPSNSTLSLGNFVATNLPITQSSNATEGRKLEVRVSGGNVNFGTPTTVTINGTTAAGPTSETLSFSQAESKITVNKFKTTTGVNVTTTPLNTSNNAAGVEIKEAYSVTVPDGNNLYPVLRYAYQTQTGFSLQGSGGYSVTDPNGFFPASDVGNLLVISSPGGVTGTYTINTRTDNTSVVLNSSLAPFANGVYSIYNITIGRSGFQNGFFFLEQAGSTNTAFNLPQGFYEFNYSSFLEIPLNPLNGNIFVGSDYNNKYPAGAIIDEFRSSAIMMSDTRVGETLPANQESITTGFISIRPFRKNKNTLTLLHFDNYPLVNDSNYYTIAEKDYIQSATSVNANFEQSLFIQDKGLEFDNNGRLATRNEGTIEFWVSPQFDTYNDPVARTYFDAASSVVEEVTSITKGTIKVSSRIGQIISVRLATDSFDTGTNYANGGTIESDRQTIKLARPLPYQKTPIKVAYIPSGLGGDRLTIFKDEFGFICFNVRASGIDYQVRQPVFWERDSWHRVRATYKFNRADNKDEIRLFIDGEERGVILFGSGLVFGTGYVFGQTTVGVTNQILVADINFKDPINQFFVGCDFTGAHPAHARIDNLRLSDKAMIPVIISGQPIDTTWNSNLNMVFPVIPNAYTTFLMDFDKMTEKVDDFAILRDAAFGQYDFTLNVIDSFRLADSERVQNIIEAMVSALKPANMTSQIVYYR